jgi:hypothetical protein
MIFEKPTVGSEITIKLRVRSISFWTIGKDYEDRTYIGTVVTDNKWTQSTEFVLFTPATPNYPNRTIQLKWITSLVYSDGKPAEQTKENTSTHQWTVDGSKGNKYLVIKAGDKFTCDCPGFQFRKTCKHVQQIAEELA